MSNCEIVNEWVKDINRFSLKDKDQEYRKKQKEEICVCFCPILGEQLLYELVCPSVSQSVRQSVRAQSFIFLHFWSSIFLYLCFILQALFLFFYLSFFMFFFVCLSFLMCQFLCQFCCFLVLFITLSHHITKELFFIKSESCTSNWIHKCIAL